MLYSFGTSCLYYSYASLSNTPKVGSSMMKSIYFIPIIFYSYTGNTAYSSDWICFAIGYKVQRGCVLFLPCKLTCAFNAFRCEGHTGFGLVVWKNSGIHLGRGRGLSRRRCISKRKMVFHFCNLFHICIKGLCSFIINKNKKTKKYKGKFVSRKTAENGLLQLCIKLRDCFLFFIPEKLWRFIVK